MEEDIKSLASKPVRNPFLPRLQHEGRSPLGAAVRSWTLPGSVGKQYMGHFRNLPNEASIIVILIICRFIR